MKTIVLLSDSHGRRRVAEKLFPLFAENDYTVHLGDGSADMRPVANAFPEKTYVLKGNCDLSYGEDECVIEVEKLRIFCCHGHKYGVKSRLSSLAERAKQLNCTVALYGHTHRADRTEVDGVICINPGSAGAWGEGSYCYLVVNGDKITETFGVVQ